MDVPLVAPKGGAELKGYGLKKFLPRSLYNLKKLSSAMTPISVMGDLKLKLRS